MFVMLVGVLMAVWVVYLWLTFDPHVSAAARKFPGPLSYPLVGNALQLGANTVEIIAELIRMCYVYHGKTFRLWLGSRLFIIVTTPQDTEIVLGSTTLIEKSKNYELLHPWLGTGLLTSTGEKWRRHRKILTPTFHFKILEGFVEVFESNNHHFVEALRKKVGGPAFDIHKYIALFTLDIICETAMGVRINALQDSESDYVKAISEQSEIMMERTYKPWLASDLIFSLTSFKSRHNWSIKILHDVTNGVIKRRRAEMTREKAANQSSEDGVKTRLAFLDLLLESTMNGFELTDEDIREEVDTFMFEGHDTTADGISFALWLLSWNQDIQDKVVKELEEVCPDPTEPVSYQTLQQLKYLERVVKETLRLYPSVPFFARHLRVDTTLNGGLVAPKGASIIVAPYIIHRDPVIFPDPEKFDPDRFLPENVQGRHPYAYAPFSAGPRNCIGQKFAMLEMKSSLSAILRNFKVLPGSETPDDLVLAAELTITIKSGVPVILESRNPKSSLDRHTALSPELTQAPDIPLQN